MRPDTKKEVIEVDVDAPFERFAYEYAEGVRIDREGSYVLHRDAMENHNKLSRVIVQLHNNCECAEQLLIDQERASDKRIVGLVKERDELQKRLAESKMKYKELEKKCAEIEEANHRIQGHLKYAENEYAGLEKKYALLENQLAPLKHYHNMMILHLEDGATLSKNIQAELKELLSED